MGVKTINDTLEAIGEEYASLALQKRTIEAQMQIIKRFLVDGLDVGGELLGDRYQIKIVQRPYKVWANPKQKIEFEQVLLGKQIIANAMGEPEVQIQFKGDII